MKVILGELGIRLSSHRILYIIINICWELTQYSLRLIFIFGRIFKIKKNKIVVSNIDGRGYSDNPKYIIDELLNRGAHYDIVWLLRGKNTNETEIPVGIRTVKSNSLKGFYELISARLWIDNAEKRLFILKRKKQQFLQTWHGFGPKKIVTNNQINGRKVQLHIKHNAKMIDAYVSNNDLLTHQYHDDFFYHGYVLQVGFPRNDVLIKGNKKIILKVFDKYSISLETHIVLYAPTYRLNTDFTVYNLNYNEILSSLEKKFGGKWIFLLRLHPVISRLSTEVVAANSGIIDVSNYLDMQELLAVTDLLITDYSSCMFDFVVTQNPCFLYHPDEKEEEKTCGFCMPLDELPFPRAHTNDELQHLIENFDEVKYGKILGAYLEKIRFIEDGNASKAVADWIEKKMEEED